MLTTIASFFSCTDEPSSLGIELISSDYVTVKTYDSINDTISQSSSYFKRVIPLGTADWFLVGRYQDNTNPSLNITASSLLKFIFGLADSLKSDLNSDNINVLDSWVEFTNRYTFTDTLGTMNFSVHKVNSYWTPFGFTIDSLPQLQYNMTDVGSDFSISDTMYTFHLDENLPLSWMKNAADNSVESNYGIYLDPSMSSTKILGFQALTPISSNAARLFVVIEKPGVYTDTINGFVSADISLVDGDVPVLPDGMIGLRSSVAINSKLTFNIGVLPPGIVINKAELIINADSINSIKGSGFSNNLVAKYLSYADSLNTEGNAVTLAYSNNKFTGDITSFVRSWVTQNENYGLLLEAGNQVLGLELFALKGSDFSTIAERPRLRVTYTQPMNL